MSHYFKTDSNLKSDVKTINYEINSHKFSMKTDNGVFAKDGLDYATKLMLEHFELANQSARVLDLGCGYGVVGKYIKTVYPNTQVDMIDVNERAIELSIENTKDLNCNVFLSNAYETVDGEYDIIITNPPIHAGKQLVHEFLIGSYNRLKNNGELWFVMNKKHGLESAMSKLVEVFEDAETIEKKKGFSIVKCTKNSAKTI